MRPLIQILMMLMLIILSGNSYSQCGAPAPMLCDIDGDRDVDSADISAISEVKGTPSSGPADIRDMDGDGMITVLDARQCVALCDEEQCGNAQGYLYEADIDASGGELAIQETGTALDGTLIVVPPGAIDQGVNRKIYAREHFELPSPIPNDAFLGGPILSLETDGESVFSEYLTITIPYSEDLISEENVPGVFYWDEAKGRYRAATVVSINRNEKTVTFVVDHFTLFTVFGTVLEDSVLLSLSLDTDFRPKTDGFSLNNFRPSDGGLPGNCLGMATYSAWYFSEKKPLQGDFYGRYSQDIETELICRSAKHLNRKWDALSKLVGYVLTDRDVLKLLLLAMTVTGEPQGLVLSCLGCDTGFGSHIVTVYGYERGTLKIYDNNFESVEATLDYSRGLGFFNYSQSDPELYGVIVDWAHAPLENFISRSRFDQLNSIAESGQRPNDSCTVTPKNEVTVYFEGRVEGTSPEYMGSDFKVGDKFSGTYVLNLDAQSASSGYGFYIGAASKVKVNIGAYSVAFSDTFSVSIENDYPTSKGLLDSFQVNGGTGQINSESFDLQSGWEPWGVVFQVSDYSGSMLDSNGVPDELFNPENIPNPYSDTYLWLYLKNGSSTYAVVAATFEKHYILK